MLKIKQISQNTTFEVDCTSINSVEDGKKLWEEVNRYADECDTTKINTFAIEFINFHMLFPMCFPEFLKDFVCGKEFNHLRDRYHIRGKGMRLVLTVE